HSEHYLHSSYTNLVITGLAGLRPRADDTLEVNPLIPAEWKYFALDDVSYHGHTVSIVWDQEGTRYNKGAGLTLIVDGKVAGNAPKLGKLEAKLATPAAIVPTDRPINFAVNNDGNYFPNLRASFGNPATPLQMLNDGAYWYLTQPANRWTTEGSPNKSDNLELNLGAVRPVESLKLYFLDDGTKIVPPEKFTVEYWDGKNWQTSTRDIRGPAAPEGRRPNAVTFEKPITTSRFRITFVCKPGEFTGLTEIEAWGHAPLPLSAPTE